MFSENYGTFWLFPCLNDTDETNRKFYYWLNNIFQGVFFLKPMKQIGNSIFTNFDFWHTLNQPWPTVRRLNRCTVRCVTVWNGIKMKRICILFIYAPFFIKNVKMTSFLPLHPLYLINVALHTFYMAAEFGCFFCRWQPPSQTWFCISLCLNVHAVYLCQWLYLSTL